MAPVGILLSAAQLPSSSHKPPQFWGASLHRLLQHTGQPEGSIHSAALWVNDRGVHRGAVHIAVLWPWHPHCYPAPMKSRSSPPPEFLPLPCFVTGPLLGFAEEPLVPFRALPLWETHCGAQEEMGPGRLWPRGALWSWPSGAVRPWRPGSHGERPPSAGPQQDSGGKP